MAKFNNIIKIALIIVWLIILSPPARAEKQNEVYFFHGNGCPHCSKAMPEIEELEKKYPEIKFNIFEIYYEKQNAILLNDLFARHDIPLKQRGIPSAFFNDKSFVGYESIHQNLESTISNCQAELSKDEPQCELVPPQRNEHLSILVIVGAAFVDSINPCAIAVLLILLGGLLASGNRKKALLSGLLFTASIYIAYFLFGLGLFSALKISGLSYWFYKTIGVIAVILGLANIKDYFWYGGAGFVVEIPRKWRPTLKKILGSVSSPLGAFLAGFVVCLFELPCTGGPYLVILGLLAETSTRLKAIPLLLLYNLVFILPLLLITILIFSGLSSTEKAGQWKERNIKLLHLIAGIVMLVLGLVIVFNLI